jgi:uncharacterized protein (DUF3084 family)
MTTTVTNVSTIFGNLNAEDLKALKSSFKEVSNCLTRIKSEREDIKSELDALFDKYKIPKKIIKRIANSYHKQSFQEELLEDKEFEAIYSGISDN